MSMTWTKDQQKVIDARNTNLLVSAAAGSGKTAVLVERILSLITDPEHPVDVDRLNQDEKMEIMEILDRKGVFLLKGSVSFVAKELHSSEASIYRYLGKLNSRSGK